MAKSKIIAHYVVPTYNLFENVAQTHIIKADYYGKTVDVDVWLASAILGDEEHSVLSSFSNQRFLYEFQRNFAYDQTQRTIANNSIRAIDNITMMLKKPEFRCTADDMLETVLARYLDEMHAIYNLKQTKLIAGILK